MFDTDATLNAMAHVICVGHSRLEMRDLLSLRDAGVENLMALGGDPAHHPAAAHAELAYATDLIELIREIGDFSVGVAAHPAGHRDRRPSLPTAPPRRQVEARRFRGHAVLLRGVRVRGPIGGRPGTSEGVPPRPFSRASCR